MVRFELVRGRKGPHDVLVRVTCYQEVLSFSEILFLLDKYFRSEEDYYPKGRGYEGSCMLLKAIVEIYSQIPLEVVLKKYGLERKMKTEIIIENSRVAP